MKKQLFTLAGIFMAVLFLSCENPMVIDILPDRGIRGEDESDDVTLNVVEETEAPEVTEISEETEGTEGTEEGPEVTEIPEVIIHKVTVSFDANGGSIGTQPITVIVGQSLPLLTETPERQGYYFAGYYNEVTGGIKYYAADLAPIKEKWDIEEDAILYAYWTLAPVYDIVFHANDGTHKTEIQEIPENATKSLRLNTFARAGYTIKGWSTTRTGIVEYNDGADYTAASGATTVNLYAVWAFNPNAFRIGDTGPGGGKIYYINEEGFTVHMVDPAQNYIAHYLESAATSQIVFAPWGAHGTFLKNITSFSSGVNEEFRLIGNGRKDTQLLLDFLGTSDKDNAALLCRNYTNNGFNDWFLPSLGELNELYTSNINGKAGNYWSSSQATINSAWILSFDSGIMGYGTKRDRYKVHAVRAF
jgi:hypothetical protein